MGMEIVVGPELNGPNPQHQSTVNIAVMDPSNINGDAVHFKLILEKIPGEKVEDFTDRAVRHAQKTIGQIAQDLASGKYKTRP